MDAAQLVGEQVTAYNDRDLERFLSFYAADAVIEDGEGNVMMRGHDQMRDIYGQMFAGSPDLHVDVPTRIDVGTWVIDEEQVRGLNAPGLPSEVHAAVVYQVIDGKIARARLLL
jgi:hypothetical protein